MVAVSELGPHGWHVDIGGAELPQEHGDTYRPDEDPEELIDTAEFAARVEAGSRHRITIVRESVSNACLTGALRAWKRSGVWAIDAGTVAFALDIIDPGIDRLLSAAPKMPYQVSAVALWVPTGRSGGWKMRGEDGWVPPHLSFLVDSTAWK
jgi:hypothetical protein